MRPLALALFLMLAAAPVQAQTQSQAADAPTADKQLTAIYTKEWQWRQSLTGDDTQVAAHLPDVSKAAQQSQLTYWQGIERQLAAIDQTKLSPLGRETYAVYKGEIDAFVAAQTFREYEKPFNSDSAFWSDLTYPADGSFHTEQDYRNYISQLSEVPRYFAQEIDNMKAGEARGFTPPKVTLDGRDTSVAAVANLKTPQDAAFYKPFLTMPATIAPGVQASLRAQAAQVISSDVIPAYRTLLTYLDSDYIPHAQTALGASAYPDGAAYYQSKIREFTTLDLTPAQIHQIGLQQVALIHAQMLDVMHEAKFDGDFPAFLQFLRTDPQFYAKTPQELLDRAAWIAKTFDGKAAHWFGRLPRARFGIVPVPADIAPYYTSGRGGPDGYLVNTYDLPSRPLFQLTALTLHESAPGHALQISLAEENKALPEFRRDGYISAYGEGWALYCEYLGQEMGMYETPYDRFGYLSYQMWRAARLVVDTGIHSMGWTREQARQYLRDNTALSEHEIDTEVDRYISWPGQALSYYLGEMAIRDARAKAEKALGPKFNIRAFHDAVLETGSVPLPVLTAHIDTFIANGGVGPYPDEEK
jgi:uncharacterized protein (DUF885 family)